MTKQSGFTLIGLLIVVALIAVIAAIMISNSLSKRLDANQASAVSALRNISSAQSQFKASAKADVDHDGKGEFGLFRELSGASGVRTTADGGASGAVLDPPIFSGAFRTIDVDGDVTRSGYCFHMYLPGDAGVGVHETRPGAALPANVNSDLAETSWCCYANPSSYGWSGDLTFFVNQTGDITGSDVATYSGHGLWGGAQAGFAFKAGGAATSITGPVAIGTRGRDGNIWKQVN